MDDEKKMKICLCVTVAALIVNGACVYSRHKYEQETQSCEQVVETFDTGEHIVSVPIKNPKKEITQYDYHDGYEVIDIEDKYILYVNDEPVKCIGTIDNNENVCFIEFGEPTELEKSNTKTYKLVPQEQTTSE